VFQKLQRGICEVTGLRLKISQDGTGVRNALSPSLDRIDNDSRDYPLGGVRLTCVQVNLARSNFDDATNLHILRHLVPKLDEMVNYGMVCV
jgi:hypothetical protein